MFKLTTRLENSSCTVLCDMEQFLPQLAGPAEDYHIVEETIIMVTANVLLNHRVLGGRAYTLNNICLQNWLVKVGCVCVYVNTSCIWKSVCHI